MKEFNVIHCRWPDYSDFTKKNNLPSTRTLERNGGILKQARKRLGLPQDNREGLTRRKTAIGAMNREMKYSLEVRRRLIDMFGEEFVHVEPAIFEDRRNRADFKIYTTTGFYLVDIFYAKDRRSLDGCIRHKTKKYKGFETSHFGKIEEVLFVCMNEFLNANKKIDKFTRVINEKEMWEIFACKNPICML